MARKIATLIIDDEKPARELIIHYLADHPEFDVVGEAENGYHALKLIKEKNPDLIFLDIQMPKITGLELIELLEKPLPAIIFSTAYDQYAIDAFEMNALDYLLKPFDKKRFNQAIAKFLERYGKNYKQDFLEKVSKVTPALDKIVVKSGYKIHIIPIEEIFYLEAQDDYVKIYSEHGNFLKQQTMKYFEEKIPGERFLRIHRSYMINMDNLARVEVIDKNNSLAVMQNGSKLPVSRTGMEILKSRFDF